RAVTRKMLGDGDDPRVAMSADEGAGESGNRVGVWAEAPVALADDGIFRIEIEIDHRAEIEVEARVGKLLGHRRIEPLRAVGRGEARIPADGARRREIAVPVFARQALHLAAFLVDGDE